MTRPRGRLCLLQPDSGPAPEDDDAPDSRLLPPQCACAACAATRSRAAWCARHRLTPDDLILPVFVLDGTASAQDVAIMPGVQRLQRSTSCCRWPRNA